ncbi:hypothetical protein JXI42_06405 [bacterium]|nr:hypothetical protein [bacterium]
MGKYDELKPEGLKRYSIKQRESKVHISDMGSPPKNWGHFQEFAESLPKILKAKDLADLTQSTKKARDEGRKIMWFIGAHVIKCGLSPILIDLIENGWVSSLSMNGAGVIHDSELTLFGQTSEDVGKSLKDGSFGMVEETNDFINDAISAGFKDNSNPGYGETIAKALLETDPPHAEASLLIACFKKGIPVTVHVAIGTDINHPHASANGAAIGELTLRDFRILANQVSKLEGGIVLNWGSAVILPEVFLKALTYARNLGYNVFNFDAANFDMIHQYRPNMNIVKRPTDGSGKGYEFTGHHEIMLPLFAAILKSMKS